MVDLTRDTGGEWQAILTTELWWDAPGESIDALLLQVPTTVAEELAGLEVDLTYPSSTTYTGLGPSGSSSDPLGYSIVTIDLPETVYDSDVLAMTVRMPKVEAPTMREVHECLDSSLVGAGSDSLYAETLCSFSFGSHSGGLEQEGWVLYALPALPASEWPEAFSVTTSFDVGTYVGVAPGEYSGSGTTFGPWEGIEANDYRALVFEDLDHVDQHTGVGSHAVHGWGDITLGVDPSSYLADDSASVYGLGGTVGYVEGLLGGLPVGDEHLVLLRQHEDWSSGVMGTHVPGVSIVDAEDAGGVELAGWEGTAMHELVHAWSGCGTGSLRAQNPTRWLVEGLPTLVAMMAYPTRTFRLDHDDLAPHYDLLGTGTSTEFISDDVFHPLVETMAYRWCAVGAGDANVEAAHEDSLIFYQGGAYMLSQAYFTHLGYDNSPASYWNKLRNLLLTSGGLDASTVRVFLDTELDAPSFYTEQISRSSAYGVPLLELSDLSWSGGSGSVELRQVQASMFAECPTGTAPIEFFDVPFYLSCGRNSAKSSIPFTECQVAEQGSLDEATGAAPDLADDYETTMSLTSAGGGSEFPAWVTVIANDSLIPGRVPYAGRGSSGWWSDSRHLLRCTSGGGACSTDDDGDGYPVKGDCDDTVALVHPLKLPEIDTSTTDDNCDSFVSTYVP